MTPAFRLLRASHRRSLSSHDGALPYALATLAFATLTVCPRLLHAQRRGDAPVAPSSALGPATEAPTFAVMGLAALPDGSGTALSQRNALWMGATQPVARIGRLHLSAVASGNYLAKQAVGSGSSVDGIASLRARALVGGSHIWSAVSIGRASVNGDLAGRLLGKNPGMLPGGPVSGGFDGARTDTTVSRRVDVGTIGRAEGGVLRTIAGVELSLGFSVERATRVTTHTLRIDESNSSLPPLAMADRISTTRTLRALQRRDIATSVASAGFQTGPTTWLVSVTAPVATWITSDALSPRPRTQPTVASLAVVQPITAWLSVVGAASTNSLTVGSTALRDDVGDGRGRNFAPVMALGVRLARLPFRGRGDDTPTGILSFDTRTIGAVDSAAIDVRSAGFDADTLRVVLIIDAPKAESVELMGDATEWVVTPLSRSKSGRWRAELKLAPGMHRISIRADGGRWIAPPGLPLGNDDYGSEVGVIVVKGKP